MMMILNEQQDCTLQCLHKAGVMSPVCVLLKSQVGGFRLFRWLHLESFVFIYYTKLWRMLLFLIPAEENVTRIRHASGRNGKSVPEIYNTSLSLHKYWNLGGWLIIVLISRSW